MIPKRIHYVWVGSPLPDAQRAYIDTWRETNPDYEFTLWNESNIDFSMPVLRRAYDERKWAKVADIARLVAVLRHDGVYLDTDFRICKPLDPLLHHKCFFGFQTKEPTKDWVANGVFGAEPGHWFVARALTRLLSIRQLPFNLDRPTKFGPKLITRLLVEEGLQTYSSSGGAVRDIFLCPTEYFFPYPFGAEFHSSCITPVTYGVHYWGRSWEKSVPGWIRLAKAIRDRARRPATMVAPYYRGPAL